MSVAPSLPGTLYGSPRGNLPGELAPRGKIPVARRQAASGRDAEQLSVTDAARLTAIVDAPDAEHEAGCTFAVERENRGTKAEDSLVEPIYCRGRESNALVGARLILDEIREADSELQELTKLTRFQSSRREADGCESRPELVSDPGVVGPLRGRPRSCCRAAEHDP